MRIACLAKLLHPHHAASSLHLTKRLAQTANVSAVQRSRLSSFRRLQSKLLTTSLCTKTSLVCKHLRCASASAVAYDGIPKLLVFGGNGFVGSRVCKEAITTGLQIVSINRSGRPNSSELWADEVEWFQADIFDVAKWRPQLEGAVGLVSCIGGFGSNDAMYKICGESNATIFKEAAAAGVARAAFISVADYKVPDSVLPGYFKGKRYAEKVLKDTFPESGVVLRPSFIHGTRNVGGVRIPLGTIGWPLEKVLNYFPTKQLSKYPLLALGFIPPVSVDAVGKAAVAAATDPAISAGILDAWEIQKYNA